MNIGLLFNRTVANLGIASACLLCLNATAVQAQSAIWAEGNYESEGETIDKARGYEYKYKDEREAEVEYIDDEGGIIKGKRIYSNDNGDYQYGYSCNVNLTAQANSASNSYSYYYYDFYYIPVYGEVTVTYNGADPYTYNVSGNVSVYDYHGYYNQYDQVNVPWCTGGVYTVLEITP